MYPALAVVGALVASRKGAEVLWIGGEGGMESSLVDRAGYAFRAIPAAGLHGVGLRAFPSNLARLMRGASVATNILNAFKPDALFFTGGYVGVPVAYAGRRYPSAMFVPDLEPALALRWISRWVSAIAVTAEASRDFYRSGDRVRVTGYPTRQTLIPENPAEARKKFGLTPELPTVLVFGGSRGAHSINEAIWQHLSDLLSEMQLIHISGELDWPRVESRLETLPPALKNRYRPFAYLHDEMTVAFSAADLVVSRAGAAVLGEYPLFGLPAILVPYPHAWRYQWGNARYLEAQGAALILKDDDLKAKVADTIRALVSDEAQRERMSAAMRALHKPGSAEQIAQILLELPASGEALDG